MAAGSEWEHVVFRELHIFSVAMKYAHHKWDTSENVGGAHGKHETTKYILYERVYMGDVTWENPLKTEVNFWKKKKEEK